MLQHEFEQLTNTKVEEDFFNKVINPMYMNTKMDKQQFCDDYKKHGLGKSSVATELTEESCELFMMVQKLKAERSAMVDFLIEQDDSRCDAKAISMVGHQEVIRRKLEKDFDLNDDDKQFLISILHD